RWNRFEMNITNKGNWPAEHVTPIVSGPVEVLGLRTIEKIEPNQKVSLEFGLKPKEAGTMDFDFEVQYTRPLDDGKHQTTDTAARGPQACLAVTLRGKEPPILPLYVVQVLKDIHDAYGPRLEEWSGDPAELPGIRDAVRKVLFATDVAGVSLGPLEDSPVSKI